MRSAPGSHELVQAAFTPPRRLRGVLGSGTRRTKTRAPNREPQKKKYIYLCIYIYVYVYKYRYSRNMRTQAGTFPRCSGEEVLWKTNPNPIIPRGWALLQYHKQRSVGPSGARPKARAAVGLRPLRRSETLLAGLQAYIKRNGLLGCS